MKLPRRLERKQHDWAEPTLCDLQNLNLITCTTMTATVLRVHTEEFCRLPDGSGIQNQQQRPGKGR